MFSVLCTFLAVFFSKDHRVFMPAMERISSYLRLWRGRSEKARNLPLRVVLNILGQKCQSRFIKLLVRLKYLAPHRISERQLQRSLCNSEDIEDFLHAQFSILKGFVLSSQDKESIAAILHNAFPQWVERTMKKADDVCNHHVAILGHDVRLGETISWHKDYISGHVWPLTYFERIVRIDLNDDSDVKFPWELSRFHHAISLGKAYLLSGDEKYAEEFTQQFTHWVEANPPYWGVNWTCAMEVAIRAINLIWAIFFFQGSRYFGRHLKVTLSQSILEHGRYIYGNLEYSSRYIDRSFIPVNGNHYMANLVGLLFISLVFPQFKESKNWFLKAYDEIINETRLQVGNDGVHYEYSPNYHRLVLELITLGILILRKNDIALPQDVWDTVAKMTDFAEHYTKPDGEAPLVRDIDNGRITILGEESLVGHKPIIQVSRGLDGRPTCEEPTEDALWLLGLDAFNHTKIGCGNDGDICSRGFSDSGFYVLRKGQLYMFAICSPVGMRGFCGHSHNDFLSFELYAFDKTFLADCGSYVYSRYPKWRNRFRSTFSHNTIVIDGHEINAINENELFEIGNDVAPRVNSWETSSTCDLLDAEYTLVFGDGHHVTHQRRFYFDKLNQYWVIKDIVLGQKVRKVETFFHFASGIPVVADGTAGFRTACGQGANLMVIALPPEEIQVVIEDAWVSKIYGKKETSKVVKCIRENHLPAAQSYLMFPVPHDKDGVTDLPEERSRRDFLFVSQKVPEIIEGLKGKGL
jgi:hypothetical protein